MLSYHTHEIYQPAGRTLCLLDPREITKYKETLYKELQYNQVFKKVDNLRHLSQTTPWNEQLENSYHALDYTITKAMLSAERKVGRFTLHVGWQFRHCAIGKPTSGNNVDLKHSNMPLSSYSRRKPSSSSSGRHVGHYKAILTTAPLVSLHDSMMSVPFLHAFIPYRWTKVTDIML
jgi:hypothetical protein